MIGSLAGVEGSGIAAAVGIGCISGLDSVPGLGTSLCHRCGHKIKKKKKERKKRKRKEKERKRTGEKALCKCGSVKAIGMEGLSWILQWALNTITGVLTHWRQREPWHRQERKGGEGRSRDQPRNNQPRKLEGARSRCSPRACRGRAALPLKILTSAQLH